MDCEIFYPAQNATPWTEEYLLITQTCSHFLVATCELEQLPQQVEAAHSEAPCA